MKKTIYQKIYGYFLKSVCLFYGHGKYYEYWEIIDYGVQSSYFACEYCGTRK